MTINTDFNIGDAVYLKTDPAQHIRQVLRVIVGPGGIEYTLGCGPDASEHYAMEISRQQNMDIVLGLDQNQSAES